MGIPKVTIWIRIGVIGLLTTSLTLEVDGICMCLKWPCGALLFLGLGGWFRV